MNDFEKEVLAWLEWRKAQLIKPDWSLRFLWVLLAVNLISYVLDSFGVI